MLTARIAAIACALALLTPAAAGASQGAKPPEANGPYGIIPPGPRSTVKAKGPYGLIPSGPRSTVRAIGPYGIIPPGHPIPTKGINAPLHQSGSTGAHAHAAGTSNGDGTNGWRDAALAEAALLAALALGWALVLSARRRPAGGVAAPTAG